VLEEGGGRASGQAGNEPEGEDEAFKLELAVIRYADEAVRNEDRVGRDDRQLRRSGVGASGVGRVGSCEGRLAGASLHAEGQLFALLSHETTHEVFVCEGPDHEPLLSPAVLEVVSRGLGHPRRQCGRVPPPPGFEVAEEGRVVDVIVGVLSEEGVE